MSTDPVVAKHSYMSRELPISRLNRHVGLQKCRSSKEGKKNLIIIIVIIIIVIVIII